MNSILPYTAARQTAALVDLSSRGRLLIGGDDRASYLQGLLSNDIETLEPGDDCYATYLTPQGRVIADMQVLNLGPELLLDVHGSVTELLVSRLRDFVFTEEVTVEDRSDTWTSLGVYGPESARVLEGTLGPAPPSSSGVPQEARELDTLEEHHHLERRFDEARVIVAGNRDLGSPGYTLYLESGPADGLKAALVSAGVPVLDPRDLDVLRVEAGRPAFPDDLGGDVIPLEAGIEDRALSMTKGCYVGQEVIVRILHRGHGRVARRLVGLTFDGATTTPDVGASLLADTDDPVGVVTSSVRSPALGRAIGLGFVKREHAEPGTTLGVSGGATLTATVTTVPFV